ncbi:AraC family transcriptional regulator [Amphibiibacter pelophylacis]|uniref:AraC family transcriptional regulator n=1 Tax=Amphibiibacter pelophylacis TaxID=1799477 RepID=A0ACC6P5K7_9BURK
MDPLSHLIQQARPQALLELRCTLGGAAQLPHAAAPAGVLPFHLVLAGQCRVRVPGQPETLLQAGDWLLLPQGSAHDLAPGQPRSSLQSPQPLQWDVDGWLPLRHDGRAAQGDPALDLLCGHFQFAAGPMQLLLRGLPPVWTVPLAPLLPTLPLMGDWLRRETQDGLPGARALVTALCQALLTLALRHSSAPAGAAPPPGTLALLGHARLRPAVQAMLGDPAQPWTLAELAQRCALSRASLARHFLQVAGQPPLAWLTAWRLALAHQALQDSPHSVADIAHSVGYSSPAALARPFAAAFGCSPASCRRSGQASDKAKP